MEIIIIEIAILALVITYFTGRRILWNEWSRKLQGIEYSDAKISDLRDFVEVYTRLTSEIAELKKRMETAQVEKKELILPHKKERGRKAPKITELQFRIDWIKMRIVFSAHITDEINKRIAEPRMSIISSGGRLFFVFSKYERYNLTGYTAYQYAASCTQTKEIMREYLSIDTNAKMTYCTVTGINWNEANTEARLPISKKINLNRI